LAAGDIVKTFRFRKETLTLKTTTGADKGQVLVYDTDGFAPATQALMAGPLSALYKKYVVIDQDVAAPASGQAQAGVLAEGVVGIQKVTGALKKGQIVGLTTTAGKVGGWADPDAPATYDEAGLQAELDKEQYKVGEVYEDAASGDTFVDVHVFH
jgi:hypothetical protein